MRKKQIYILLLICLNIGADQYSKYLVREKVVPGSRTELVGELLQLMNVENSGAFLGMGSEANPTIKMIFLLIVPLLVLTSVLYYLFTNKSIDRLTTIGLSCVVGGGIANLYDRFVYGSVTDFLFMDFNFARTGIFNFADLSVSTGMILILWSAVKSWQKGKTKKQILQECFICLVSLFAGLIGLFLGAYFGRLMFGEIGKYTAGGVFAFGLAQRAYIEIKKLLITKIENKKES